MAQRVPSEMCVVCGLFDRRCGCEGTHSQGMASCSFTSRMPRQSDDRVRTDPHSKGTSLAGGIATNAYSARNTDRRRQREVESVK